MATVDDIIKQVIKMYDEISLKAYYLLSEKTPKVTRQYQPGIFYLGPTQYCDHSVFLMHPEVFPQFKELMEKQGILLVDQKEWLKEQDKLFGEYIKQRRAAYADLFKTRTKKELR